MATLNDSHDVENFSIADQSTAPYAWIAENADLKAIAKMALALAIFFSSKSSSSKSS